MSTPTRHALRLLVLALGLTGLALAVWRLETARSGVELRAFTAGSTPATLYATGADGPLVIVAHGFAGSRQLMEAFSLTLARAGYRVAAFDFEGHGRNPVPMSGDVTAIDGTTARLVAETRRVIAAARELTGYEGPVALLGHSMASDIVVRTALAEGEQAIAAVVAVSMFSEAVTATEPARLLALSGAWEPYLRVVALDAARLVDPDAREGETVRSGAVERRAAVAPYVEHVGVLYSPASLEEARDWLDAAYGRESAALAQTGPWVSALLAALVALVWPLAAVLGQHRAPVSRVATGRFIALIAVPAVLAPVIAAQLSPGLLPVLVAEPLAVHLFLYGGLQIAALLAWRHRFGPLAWPALALLLAWGLGVFGFLMDRYVASFAPSGDRWAVIAALTIGTLPFMVADSALTEAGRGPLWRRIAARTAVFLSLGLAVALNPEELFFLVIIFPVLLLFFLVHGLMGRWIGQHAGVLAPGLGLGLILAWALGVSFPMFQPVP